MTTVTYYGNSSVAVQKNLLGTGTTSGMGRDNMYYFASGDKGMHNGLGASHCGNDWSVEPYQNFLAKKKTGGKSRKAKGKAKRTGNKNRRKGLKNKAEKLFKSGDQKALAELEKETDNEISSKQKKAKKGKNKIKKREKELNKKKKDVENLEKKAKSDKADPDTLEQLEQAKLMMMKMKSKLNKTRDQVADLEDEAAKDKAAWSKTKKKLDRDLADEEQNSLELAIAQGKSKKKVEELERRSALASEAYETTKANHEKSVKESEESGKRLMDANQIIVEDWLFETADALARLEAMFNTTVQIGVRLRSISKGLIKTKVKTMSMEKNTHVVWYESTHWVCGDNSCAPDEVAPLNSDICANADTAEHVAKAEAAKAARKHPRCIFWQPSDTQGPTRYLVGKTPEEGGNDLPGARNELWQLAAQAWALKFASNEFYRNNAWDGTDMPKVFKSLWENAAASLTQQNPGEVFDIITEKADPVSRIEKWCTVLGMPSEVPPSPSFDNQTGEAMLELARLHEYGSIVLMKTEELPRGGLLREMREYQSRIGEVRKEIENIRTKYANMSRQVEEGQEEDDGAVQESSPGDQGSVTVQESSPGSVTVQESSPGSVAVQESSPGDQEADAVQETSPEDQEETNTQSEFFVYSEPNYDRENYREWATDYEDVDITQWDSLSLEEKEKIVGYC